MSETNPPGGTPPEPTQPTPPAGGAPPPAPTPGESPSTAPPGPPASPPAPPASTQPGPAGPPPSAPTTTAGAFTAPGGPPPKTRKGGIPLPAFIVVLVLLVAALAFAIVSFTGKNSEADKKDKAQKELASTKKQLQDTEKKLGTARGAGQLLANLVTTGKSAADDLKSCADSSRSFITQFGNSLTQIVTGGGVPPQLETAATDADNKCATADQSYSDFNDALSKVQNS